MGVGCGAFVRVWAMTEGSVHLLANFSRSGHLKEIIHAAVKNLLPFPPLPSSEDDSDGMQHLRSFVVAMMCSVFGKSFRARIANCIEARVVH